MSATHLSAEAGYLPDNEGVFSDITATKSAFLRAANARANFPVHGITYNTFKAGSLEAVDEAGTKPNNQGVFTPAQVNAQKLANQEIFACEVEWSDDEIEDIIKTEVLGGIGKSVDNIIAGAGTGSLSGLSTVTSYDVSTEAELNTAFAAIEVAGGVPLTAVVLSTAALRALKGLRLSGGAYSVLKDLGDPANPGYIDGLPVYVYEGSDATQLFVGDFKDSARAGVVRGFPTIRRENSVVIGDGGTVEVLSSTNRFALITETLVAFKVASLDRFGRIKIVPEVTA